MVTANPTNAIDLCTSGLTAPSGESWSSLAFSGRAGNASGIAGWDVVVTNMAANSGTSPFTQTALSTLLPATFPGMPASGQAINIVVENPSQPANASNTVGNSAVLNFASDITRPASGTKTLYISYLFSVAQQGAMGSGNDGRYLDFVASTNTVEGTGTSFFKYWLQMFNNFNTTSNRYCGHALIQDGTSFYIGAADSSLGKDFSTSPFVSGYNTPNFVVGAYTFTSGGLKDTNTIWVNPSTSSFGGATPPSVNLFNNTMAFNMSDIGALVLENRVGSGAAGGLGTNYIANLIIGTTWSYVTGGPEFTNQPVSVSGTNGTVSMSAAATAAGQTVSYQWQHVTGATTNNLVNGAVNPGGSASVSIVTNNNVTTLTLTGISSADAGSYQVVATASGTGYTLASSTATVTNDPIITVEPISSTVPRGGTAVFNISASTASPPLTFTWELNGVPIVNGQVNGDGSSYSVVTNGGGSSSTFTISGMHPAEDGTVTCGVTNSLGNGEVSSPNVMAAVSDPAFTTQPQSVTTNYGATVAFSATVNTIHSPISYAWYAGSTMLVNGTQPDGSVVSGAQGVNGGSSFNATLTISGVTYQENNSYTLIATNSIANAVSSTPATLTVLDPYISAEPPAMIEVPVGNTTSLNVGAAGSGITYQWYWTNGSGVERNSGDISGATTSSLHITSAQTNDSGTYVVVVTGASGISVTSTPVAFYAETAVTSVVATPAAINQMAGTHLAILGNVTGGAPYAKLQWTRNGVPVNNGTQADGSYFSNAVATITSSGTVPFWIGNAQVADSGTYELVVSNSNGAISNSPAVVLTITPAPTPLSTSNLVVLRVGEGSEPLSGATGNTVYLDQFETNGSYVSSIMVPDSGGSTMLLPGGAPTSGNNDSMNEGYMTLSSNGAYLNFAGYFQTYPYTLGPTVTFGGAANPRGIGAVNGLGYYVLAYTNEGLYSGGFAFIRDAYSTDGLTNFWTTGAAGSSAIKYVNAGPLGAGYATGTGVPALGAASISNGPACLGLFGTNLAFTDFVGTDANGAPGVAPTDLAQGLNTFTGAPQSNPANGGATNLIYVGNAADFAFSPDQLTLYLADSSTAIAGGTGYGGGIQRYDFNGTSYAYSYTLEDSTGVAGGMTNGVRGVAVYFPSSVSAWGPGVTGAVVYATTSEVVSNRLIQIVDTGVGSTSTLLSTAGANQFFRGVRFGPATVPVSIAVAPQSTNTYTGQADTLSVTAGGDGPFTYQWQFDGTNIVNATNSTLALTNLQASQSGTYTVVITDPISTNSASAIVSVTAGPPVLVASPRSLVETAGDHTAFSVGVTGTLPIYYQWATNGVNIPGATGSSLVLTNITVANSGTYSVTYSNMFGSNTVNATLLVTPNNQYLSSNNLVVARVGDGAQTLSDVTGNTLYFDQITTSGVYSNTIMIPDSAASNNLIVAGGTTVGVNESFLTLSANSNALNFIGYDTNYPNTSSPPFNTASANPGAGSVFRSLGALNAFGYFTVAQVNETAYVASPYDVESATSVDGLGTNGFYTTGFASGPTGVKFLTPATAGPAGGNYGATSSANGTRVVQIVNGNVVFSDLGSTPVGLWAFAGEPTAANPLTPTAVLTDGAGAPNDFAPSPDTTTFPPTTSTVYVADISPVANGGGIQRYDWNGSAYALSYTLGTGAGSTNGASCLTVDFSGHSSWGAGVTGAIIYATTAGTVSNSLIKIVDNGAGSSASRLLVAPPNELLRGVRFGPVVQPLAIVSGPGNTNAVAGQEVDYVASATGTGPLSYQWALNGTNIPGATSSVLALQNVQVANAGSYTVTVSNPVGSSLTSSPAGVLTVNPFSATSSSLPLVGWWKLNDGSGTTAVDSSSFGDNATLNSFADAGNAEWVSPGLDTNSFALNFDNADNNGDNVVTAPDQPQLNFTNNLAFTVAAWIDSASLAQTNGAGIVTKGYGAGGEQFNLDIFTNSAPVGGTIRFFVRSAGGTVSQITTAAVPTVGHWEHVAATYDGYSGAMALYTNGVLVGTATGPSSLLYSTYPVSIGNRAGTVAGIYNQPVFGEMQDVRLYDVSLSAADIQSIYSVLAVASSPQTVVYANPPLTGQPGAPVLHFSGKAGNTYKVWTTTDLSLQPIESTWTLLGTGTFSGGNDTFTCPAGASTTQYYAITQP